MKKTVLITGASRGIGSACALSFASLGYNVAINYNKNQVAAEQTARQATIMGANAKIFCADVGDADAVNKMVTQVNKQFGDIDILVNNAGISKSGLFVDMTKADFDELLRVNLFGIFNATKAVLPQMLSKNRGSIVNISSVWGQTGGSCETLYSATKSAVIGLTKALAKEVSLSGVRVNCVCPGVIQTEMLGALTQKDLDDLKDATPLNRLGTPTDVAKAVVYLSSEDASFVTGQVLGVNGGFYI